ncbi:MAG: co-chaperone GroES [bacterium]|nr:co-chaperone GroES [bacterium]
MQIRPLHDRVIVKRKEAVTTTASGIIIPDTAKEKPQEGEVIAVGKGVRKDDGSFAALDVKAGDKILFGKYAGTEINVEGDTFLMMKEDEILGVIEG